MGLFDAPEVHNLSEDFPEGTPMRIHWYTFDGPQPTSFGPRSQATIGVTLPDGKETEAVSYRVWGTLADQISKADDSDFDNPVTIRKEGRMNVWAPVT